MVYYSHVYSNLNYAILSYGSANKGKLNHLNVLQRKIVRAICQHTPRAGEKFTTSKMFKKLNILKLEDMFKLELLKYLHKASRMILPKSLMENLTIKNKNDHYQLRSNKRLQFTKNRSQCKIYEQSIAYLGPKLWDNTEEDLKKLEYNKFIKAIKNKLLSDY